MNDQPLTVRLRPGHKRTVFLAINGIRFRPGTARGWPERMCDWINCRMPDGVIADRREYYTTAVTRFIGQRKRTDELARKVSKLRHAGYRLVLVGHSNGCDVTGRLLRDLGIYVDACHLFAPAAMEEDYEDALINEMVGRIHIYGSMNDKALQWGSVTRALFGWLGLGYGSLGLRGGDFAAKYPDRVKDHSNHSFGHSSWWDEGANFERSMRLIIENDTNDQKQIAPPP